MNAKVSFHSDLANVMYGTPAPPEREVEEVRMVEGLRSFLSRSTSSQIFKSAPMIDAVVMPLLSGRNALAVAKLLEVRSPNSIPNMPNISDMQSEMDKTARLEKIMLGLPRMIEALQYEEQGVKK